MRSQGKQPFRIVTYKLKSYAAAKRTILPNVGHNTRRYANNRVSAKASLLVPWPKKAVRDGFTALCTRAPRLLRDLAVARADGSFGKLLDRLARIDVLIVDDWAMAPLADSERRDFLEICDDRYAIRSTVLTSQVPITHWA